MASPDIDNSDSLDSIIDELPIEKIEKMIDLIKQDLLSINIQTTGVQFIGPREGVKFLIGIWLMNEYRIDRTLLQLIFETM